MTTFKSSNRKIDTNKDGRPEVEISFDIQPNVLDNLANYTWHFRLFMINETLLNEEINKVAASDTNSNFLKVINAVPQITLAETGSTSLYIEDVRIENVVAPTLGRPTGEFQKMEFKIIEPYGTNFMDLVRKSADFLGIEGYLNLPWFFELSFVGYNENGKNIVSSDDSNIRKLYRINIQTMNMKVDERGSTYAFTVNPGVYRSTGGSLQKIAEPMNLLIKESATGELTRLMKAFEKHAQKVAIRRAITENVVLDLPYFVFHEIQGGVDPTNFIQWEGLKIISNTNYDNKAGDYSSPGEATPAPQKKYNVPDETPFVKVIQAMISSTDWGDKHIKQIVTDKLEQVAKAETETTKSKKDPATEKDKSKKKNIFPDVVKFIQIEIQTIFLDYNPKMQDFNRISIYHIYPYDGLSAWIDTQDARIASFNDTKNNLKNKTKDKLDKISRAVKKEYTYLFGRDNTDIESMDIELNNLYHHFTGQSQNYRASTNIAAASPLVKRAVDGSGRRELNIPSTLAADVKQAANLEAGLNSAATILETLDNDIRRRQLRAANNFADGINDAITEQKINQRQEVENVTARAAISSIAATRAREDSKRLLNQRRAFAEDDLGINPKEGLNAVLTTIVESSKTVSTTNAYAGTSTTRPEATSIFNTVANNMVTTGELLKMDFKIRGDPWWLGTSTAETHIIRAKSLIRNKVINFNRVNDLQQELQSLSFLGPLARNNTDISSQISTQSDRLFNELTAPLTAITNPGENVDDPVDPGNIIRVSDLENADLYSGVIRNRKEMVTSINQIPILFKMYSPDILATTGDTGIAALKESELVSGIWIALRVQSTFDTDGRFMQTINTFRDTSTTAVHIKKAVDKRNGQNINTVGDIATDDVAVGATDGVTKAVAQKKATPTIDTALATTRELLSPQALAEARIRADAIARTIPIAPGSASDDSRRLAELVKLSDKEFRKLALRRTIPRVQDPD